MLHAKYPNAKLYIIGILHAKFHILEFYFLFYLLNILIESSMFYATILHYLYPMQSCNDVQQPIVSNLIVLLACP